MKKETVGWDLATVALRIGGVNYFCVCLFDAENAEATGHRRTIQG